MVNKRQTPAVNRRQKPAPLPKAGEAPARAAPQASFGYWLFQVHRRMHAIFLERLAPLGVTGAQWALLAWLEAGPKSPAAIASRLGVDRAAVSRLIDQLESQGLVSRQPGPRDRRVVLISLTRQGLVLLPKLKQVSAETNREFLSLIEPSQAAQLLALIRLLGERIENSEPPVTG